MGRECHDVTSHWSYFGRQVTCPHNFCQDCSLFIIVDLDPNYTMPGYYRSDMKFCYFQVHLSPKFIIIYQS